MCTLLVCAWKHSAFAWETIGLLELTSTCRQFSCNSDKLSLHWFDVLLALSRKREQQTEKGSRAPGAALTQQAQSRTTPGGLSARKLKQQLEGVIDGLGQRVM